MSTDVSLDLIDCAELALIQACDARLTGPRQRGAELAARQAAAAVVAARSRSLGSGLHDPWLLLQRLAPELTEWADYFRLLGTRRGGLVGVREADDTVRAAESFMQQVRLCLGLPSAAALSVRLAPVHIGP